MTITIDLSPGEETKLRHEAARHGKDVKALARDLLLSHIRALDDAPETDEPSTEAPLPFDPVKLDAALAALAEGAEALPVLPPEALTREGLYRDHD